jgi:3-phenylpropionate/trans-cinnamate dioxygenase ferredoxin reductase subunit
VEHWENARQEGRVAAESMLDRPTAHERLSYFFTDQYDLGMEYTGFVDPTPGSDLAYDQVVFRGDQGAREFIVFWLRQGRALAGMNVNVWDVVDDVAALITSGRQLDPARLADPSVPLDHL